MNSEGDNPESRWRSAEVVLLILVSLLMPFSTFLFKKPSNLQIASVLCGLWAAFSLWISLDAARLLRSMGPAGTGKSNQRFRHTIYALTSLTIRR